MDAALVGPPVPADRLAACLNVILSYQNGDGGFATYENKRSFEALEVRWQELASQSLAAPPARFVGSAGLRRTGGSERPVGRRAAATARPHARRLPSPLHAADHQPLGDVWRDCGGLQPRGVHLG